MARFKLDPILEVLKNSQTPMSAHEIAYKLRTNNMISARTVASLLSRSNDPHIIILETNRSNLYKYAGGR